MRCDLLHVLSETPLNVFMRFVGSSEGGLVRGRCYDGCGAAFGLRRECEGVIYTACGKARVKISCVFTFPSPLSLGRAFRAKMPQRAGLAIVGSGE